MAHLALYRQWRPQLFADVVGQSHVVTTLSHALEFGRLAHAYLFTGPRGTGKTSVAKILAKAVNCERLNGIEPCNSCPSCLGIMAGQVVDVVEMDAASNRGIDEIRSLLEQVRYAPAEVRRKVYIIDEVHMLTQEAFNALLKTLEEPPDYCLFVLATTEVHKVPATIASRCQRFDFGRVKTELVVDRLKKVANTLPEQVEDAALWYIARVTEGGMRDALSLLDQTLAFSESRVGVEQVAEVLGGVSSEQIGSIYRAIFLGDSRTVLEQLDRIWGRGHDPAQLVTDLIAYGRDAIVLKNGVAGTDADDRKNFDPTFSVVVQHVELKRIFQVVERLARLQTELRYQAQGRLYVEVGLLALTSGEIDEKTPATQTTDASLSQPGIQMMKRELSELSAKVQELEKRLSRGGGERKLDLSRIDPPQDVQEEVTFVAPPQAITSPVRADVRKDQVLSSPATRSEPSVLIARQTDKAGDDEAFQYFLDQWQALLEQIKQRSIQTRAWLFAGRPVKFDQGRLWVAFKTAIHAQTVMRSPHREIIDEVLSHLRGTETRLYAILETDWDNQQLSDATKEETKDLQREPWVEKVVEWFGANRVTIDDSKGDDVR